MRRLRAPARILDLGSGSGRNAAALVAAGYDVLSVPDAARYEAPPGLFDGAVASHALLHGTSAVVAANLRAVAASLAQNAPLCAAFGSVRDARFGCGKRIDDSTFAPTDGDEAGVPHAFFEEATLLALVARDFEIETIEERNVDRIAGAWAHAQAPLAGAVHWFVIAHATRRAKDLS